MREKENGRIGFKVLGNCTGNLYEWAENANDQDLALAPSLALSFSLTDFYLSRSLSLTPALAVAPKESCSRQSTNTMSRRTPASEKMWLVLESWT